VGSDSTVIRDARSLESGGKPRYIPVEQRDDMIRLYLAGKNLEVIAKTYGRDPTAISRVMRRAGVLRPNPRPIIDRLNDPIVIQLLGKVPDRRLAAALGCHRSTVKRHRRGRKISGYRRKAREDLPRPMLWSLDAGYYSLNYHDVIKDDSCSDWLEESGATVW